jgi:pimeloyl-ACP methyl ester carboxylesterase
MTTPQIGFGVSSCLNCYDDVLARYRLQFKRHFLSSGFANKIPPLVLPKNHLWARCTCKYIVYPVVMKSRRYVMKTNRLLKGLKMIFIGLFVFLFIVSITGLIYQTAATETDRQNYPPPGNLIDVGGFKMHIHCAGQGQPTVILEALSGGFSSYWALVQPEVAKQVRVCAYDRAGFGWSGSDPEPESPQRTARNLHVLLTNAGIQGPYVLVGHSKGGLYVRQFAEMFPQEVAGLVLLDSAHPDQFQRHPDWLKGDTAVLLRWMPLIKALLRLGVGHAYFALGGEADFPGLPTRQHDEIAAAWSSVRYWQSQEASMRAGERIFQEAHDLGALGDLPVAVVSRDCNLDAAWGEQQNELAALSTNSIHIFVDGSTHVSLIFNPDHARVVNGAILQVVEAVQNTSPLKP